MALDFKVVDSYNHKMTKDELIQELKDSIMTGDVQKQKDLVSDMSPFAYRDTYGSLLNDVVENDYGVRPKIKSNTYIGKRGNEDLISVLNGIEPEYGHDMSSYAVKKYGFGHDWSGLKDLFEEGRIPLTNDLRYHLKEQNNILTRNEAGGAFQPSNRNIHLFRPEHTDRSTWKTSTALHEIAHDKQFVNDSFDSVPYGYGDTSIANRSTMFGNIKSKTNTDLLETAGGRQFMNDLYIHDRPMFDEIIKNRGDIIHDVARGDAKAESVFSAMPFRSYFSKGADMAENFWKGHHKYGVFERDAAERLLSNKKLRSITGALPYIGATMAGLSAWDSAKAGDYEGAGKTIGKEALSHVPFIGDSLEPVGGKEDMVDSYLSEVAHKVSEEEDRLINLVKNKKLEGLSNE